MGSGTKPDKKLSHTEQGLVVTEFLGPPVIGEVFLLTTPFIEPPRPLLRGTGIIFLDVAATPPQLRLSTK
jgi:hypothetical protein